MSNKFLPLLALPLLLVGCSTTFTNLTPQHQVRNPDNLYPVEVAISSREQALRWNSIRPQVIVGTEAYPMRPTPLMTNRWEGLVPVPPGKDAITYRYKFDYDVNSFGKPKQDSAFSPEYSLQVQGAK